MVEKVDKHKEKLIRVVSEEVTTLFETVLDYTEVAVTNNDRYAKLRSKILRAGNNCIRQIGKEINTHYIIQYDPPGETIIEIRNSKTAKA